MSDHAMNVQLIQCIRKLLTNVVGEKEFHRLLIKATIEVTKFPEQME
jgi:hypothetical protein